MTDNRTWTLPLTRLDPPCKKCGRPANAHGPVDRRCPEWAAGIFAVYTPVTAQS